VHRYAARGVTDDFRSLRVRQRRGAPACGELGRLGGGESRAEQLTLQRYTGNQLRSLFERDLRKCHLRNPACALGHSARIPVLG
jgi:hypothetical protein